MFTELPSLLPAIWKPLEQPEVDLSSHKRREKPVAAMENEHR